MPKTILIAGANRGLGLEFARQYAADGEHVIATCRRPAEATELRRLGVRIETLDTSSQSSIRALAERLSGQSVDVLICNAGVYGPRSEALADLPTEDFDLVMRTNVLGPLRLALAFAEAVARARGVMAFLSSRMGSISDMSATSGIAYRASKAALNAVVKAASIELGRRGVRVLALHPGWVRTDMGGPQATLSPQESVAGMKQVIGKASALHGGFYDYTGAAIPW
ncbi:MAG: SDR family NAD(P)-dependent oxidoreductase [Casimicrobiaceae bacterium]|nr:SDR family NAD(P)-dependent oxidoreductase [Casimicrobiaceae bacterium]MCX8097635.1 SDR family NAD(P)-dependent oxidoreductase [Casimicrobiaceae bacterium]MDW8311931.1 SDR family NAD(P)-dependent oxidoreductase [Burkholderiales bacterium]